jgi:uncharacterized peroxidase-related enzyme
MSRVTVIDPRTADGAVRTLLDAVQSQLGVVPNFVRVLANSGAALSGFLGLYAGVGESRIDAATRERIALAIAEGNACRYCVSAHTAIGRKTGLTNDEMQLNRRGTSADAKAAAAVAFAVALNQHMGEVTADEVEAVRRAGFDDGEIVEIIAIVVLNIFTNVIGKATQVDIDFPQVALLRSPLAA